MRSNSELKTQAQHDRIENRPGFHCPKRDDAASDDFQFLLWERKIFADIVNFDREQLTCNVVGGIVAMAAAIKVLATLGIKASPAKPKTKNQK